MAGKITRNELHQSVNDELSKINEHQAELERHQADIATQINTLDAETAKKIDVNNALIFKADKSYVDTVTQSIASGSPKPVSLVSQMTDTTKSYLYTGVEAGYTSGNWYYWNGSAWTSGGVYQSATLSANNALLTDSNNNYVSTDVEGALQEVASELFGAVTPQKTNFFNLSPNLYDGTVFGGYIDQTDGTLVANASHKASDYIKVSPLTNYTYSNEQNSKSSFRYALYDANKNYIAGGIGVNAITTTAETKYVRFSDSVNNTKQQLEAGDEPTPYRAYSNVYIPKEYIEGMQVIVDSINGNTIIKATADTMSNGSTLTVAERLDINKNCIQEFYADITTFDSVTVGHGKTKIMSSYIVVNNVNVTLYYHNGVSASVTKQSPHGLTISDYIHVLLDTDDKTTIKCTITTASGTYTFTSLGYYGCNENIFASTTSELTNCKCVYIPKDMKEDIYLFGDSYVTLADDTRYSTQLVKSGYANLLISGYGGASAQAQMTSFRNIIALRKPKYAIWTLGMNNGDVGAINSLWLTATQEFITTCLTNNIVPILATIPNVPSVNNTYKNAWVKASGYRYIDFAKAVGAEESGSTWYTGMLSADNVHPALLGGKALMSRFLLDVPEIFNVA